MTDEIVSFSQDTKDGSYSFGFSLNSGTGLVMSTTINVAANEAATPDEAKIVALQAAADEKQEWLDTIANSTLLGSVDLPQAKKKTKMTADQPVNL